jgi:hypothetical protein
MRTWDNISCAVLCLKLGSVLNRLICTFSRCVQFLSLLIHKEYVHTVFLIFSTADQEHVYYCTVMS